MTVTPELFRAALSRFASGVTVVTSLDRDGRPHGLTVSAFCSVSLQPPLVLISLGLDTRSRGYVSQLGRFAVNVLADDHEEFSRLFSQRERPDDPFQAPWTPGPHGLPHLDGALAVLDCRVVQAVEAGDHTLFIGEVESAGSADGAPLLYYRAAYRRLAE